MAMFRKYCVRGAGVLVWSHSDIFKRVYLQLVATSSGIDPRVSSANGLQFHTAIATATATAATRPGPGLGPPPPWEAGAP
jgi:hypothetical protein